jgi:hypothetical protein
MDHQEDQWRLTGTAHRERRDFAQGAHAEPGRLHHPLPRGAVSSGNLQEGRGPRPCRILDLPLLHRCEGRFFFAALCGFDLGGLFLDQFDEVVDDVGVFGADGR